MQYFRLIRTKVIDFPLTVNKTSEESSTRKFSDGVWTENNFRINATSLEEVGFAIEHYSRATQSRVVSTQIITRGKSHEYSHAASQVNASANYSWAYGWGLGYGWGVDLPDRVLVVFESETFVDSKEEYLDIKKMLRSEPMLVEQIEKEKKQLRNLEQQKSAAQAKGQDLSADAQPNRDDELAKLKLIIDTPVEQDKGFLSTTYILGDGSEYKSIDEAIKRQERASARLAKINEDIEKKKLTLENKQTELSETSERLDKLYEVQQSLVKDLEETLTNLRTELEQVFV